MACGAAAALIRPEAWAFLAVYAVFLWRRHGGRWPVLLATVIAVPLLWVLPGAISSGQFLQASAHARADIPANIRDAAHPGLRDVALARDLLPWPVLLAAAVALGSAIWKRNRPVIGIALCALGWLAVVAGMAEAGYPGVPRFLVVAIFLTCVLAGIGCSRIAAAAGSSRARVAVAATALVALQVAFLAGRADEVRREQRGAMTEARIVGDLQRLVGGKAGAGRIIHCGVVATNPYTVPALAWTLGPDAQVTYSPRAAAVVFRGAASSGSPPAPRVGPNFRLVRQSPRWRELSRCRLPI